MNKIKTLNLEDYGQVGLVEISVPSLRKRVMRDNALGNCTDTKIVDGKPVISEYRVGDAAIIKVLAYVRRAPFPTDLKGFLTYCDKMDENDLGSAERLLEDIEKAALEIEGEETPLAGSQEAETPTSD